MAETIKDIVREMREIRPDCDDCISNHTCDYLSRFADRIEKVLKAESEKRYEYAVKEFGSYIHPVHSDSATAIDGLSRGDDNCVIVRRSVGEWEEVDGHGDR